VELKDAVAVVTGEASGLGGAKVCRLVAGGARVAILDLAREAGERLVRELDPGILFLETDVTDEDGTARAWAGPWRPLERSILRSTVPELGRRSGCWARKGPCPWQTSSGSSG